MGKFSSCGSQGALRAIRKNRPFSSILALPHYNPCELLSAHGIHESGHAHLPVLIARKCFIELQGWHVALEYEDWCQFLWRQDGYLFCEWNQQGPQTHSYASALQWSSI